MRTAVRSQPRADTIGCGALEGTRPIPVSPRSSPICVGKRTEVCPEREIALSKYSHITSAPYALERAATWIGRFHARNESRVTQSDLRVVKSYTAEYYSGWARRTLDACVFVN